MIGFILSPMGRYIGGALLILAIIGGVYLKGRNAGEHNAIESINATNALAKNDQFIACVKRDRAEQKGALRVAVAIANGTGLLLGFAAANAKAIGAALGVVVVR